MWTPSTARWPRPSWRPIGDARDSETPSPVGVVVQGQRGSGKTHLLGWIRSQVQRQDGYFFLVGLLDGSRFWPSVAGSMLDGLTRQVTGHETQTPRVHAADYVVDRGAGQRPSGPCRRCPARPLGHRGASGGSTPVRPAGDPPMRQDPSRAGDVQRRRQPAHELGINVARRRGMRSRASGGPGVFRVGAYPSRPARQRDVVAARPDRPVGHRCRPDRRSAGSLARAVRAAGRGMAETRFCSTRSPTG